MKFLRFTMIAGMLCLAFLTFSCASSPEAKSARFIENGKKLLKKNDASRAILEFKNAVRVTPKNADAHYQLGLAYLAAGDLANGIAGLRNAIALDPKHIGARLRLAELMTYAPDDALVKDAKQRLESLLEEDPNNPDVLQALALTELKLRDPQEAMQHLEQAFTAMPKELSIAATLADAKLQARDTVGAEAVLKQACSNLPKSADCMVLLGRLYAVEKRTSEAEQMFHQAVGMESNNVPALLNLATLQAATGRRDEAEKTFQKLSSSGDKRFSFYHATFLFEMGRKDEAVKEFENLAKADPADRERRTRLVAAYQAVNRTPDALKILESALKKNGNDLDALLQRGEISLAAAKYDQSEADLNRVLHLKPDSPEVHYVLARVQAGKGVVLVERQELNEALRLNPFFLAARLDLAKELIADGEAQAAVDLLNQAPQTQRGSLPLIEQRNWALLSGRRTQEARKGVDEGLAIGRTADLLEQDAFLKILAKRYDEARQADREALAKSPEDLRALRILVNSYSAQSQIPAAVRAVQDYAAQHPKSAVIQYFLGSLLMANGDRTQARKVLLLAKAANPDFRAADLALAQVDLALGNWNDARQPLNGILSKKEDPQARKWLGMLEVSAGNQAAAIADFRKVIELQPDDAVSLNDLAYLLVESDGGTSEEALKFAERAVQLAPQNPDFQDTLGWVLYRRGLYDNAVSHIQAALAKAEEARYRYHLAMAYYKAGDAQRGSAMLQAALHRDPNLPEAKLAQKVSQESQNK